MQRKKMFRYISYAWKWLFFTKRSRTLRQPSESLCNRRPCYFPFRSTATVTIQFAMYSGAMEDTRQDKRAKEEAFWKVSAAHVRRFANIKWSPLYHSCLSALRRTRFPGSILSPLLPLRSCSYLSSLNCKDEIGKYDKEDSVEVVRRSFSRM